MQCCWRVNCFESNWCKVTLYCTTVQSNEIKSAKLILILIISYIYFLLSSIVYYLRTTNVLSPRLIQFAANVQSHAPVQLIQRKSRPATFGSTELWFELLTHCQFGRCHLRLTARVFVSLLVNIGVSIMPSLLPTYKLLLTYQLPTTYQWDMFPPSSPFPLARASSPVQPLQHLEMHQPG